MTGGKTHHEAGDDYHRELFRSGSYRVPVCRDGVQWLYQRQAPRKGLAGARWRTLGNCRSPSVLKRLCREHSGIVPDELSGFPDRFMRENGNVK